MFIIFFFLIYGAGRAIGWLTLSLTMGREVLLEEPEPKQNLLAIGWFIVSLALAGLLCFKRTNWGFSLPY